MSVSYILWENDFISVSFYHNWFFYADILVYSGYSLNFTVPHWPQVSLLVHQNVLLVWLVELFLQWFRLVCTCILAWQCSTERVNYVTTIVAITIAVLGLLRSVRKTHTERGSTLTAARTESHVFHQSKCCLGIVSKSIALHSVCTLIIPNLYTLRMWCGRMNETWKSIRCF